MWKTGSCSGEQGHASQVALVVKNLPANAGDIRDVGSAPKSGRSLGEGNGSHGQGSLVSYSL